MILFCFMSLESKVLSIASGTPGRCGTLTLQSRLYRPGKGTLRDKGWALAIVIFSMCIIMRFMIQNHDLFVVKEERSTLNHIETCIFTSMYETYVVHNYTHITYIFTTKHI